MHIAKNPHSATRRLILAAQEILGAHNPMTIRQLHYQLVSLYERPNTQAAYKALSEQMSAARLRGDIPWEWIEDRLRGVRSYALYDGIAAFIGDVSDSYARDTWASQSRYFELWLEKEALSGIFDDARGRYRVALNVGRGYDGWSSIKDAADRLPDGAEILYFGDFDPSGEDMVRSLQHRLRQLGCSAVVTKCALTLDQIAQYRLPPNLTKKTDRRREAHVARYGDLSVELDALPVAVLREIIEHEIRKRIDLVAFHLELEREAEERASIHRRLGLA